VAKKVKKTSKKKAANKKAKAKIKKTKAKKAVTKKKTVKKSKAKKTVGRKAPPQRKIRISHRTKPLTNEEIEDFKQMLLVKRAEIIGDVSTMENESLKKSRLDAAGDLSSMPIHMADIGTDNFEQEFALGLMDSERKILVKINAALQRIDAGTYGICEGTGKPIAKARLKARPWARHCIEYATMVEQGLVIEGEKVYDDNKEQGFEDENDNELVDDESL
jgi:RNA polymerase-binding protein DksA